MRQVRDAQSDSLELRGLIRVLDSEISCKPETQKKSKLGKFRVRTRVDKISYFETLALSENPSAGCSIDCSRHKSIKIKKIRGHCTQATSQFTCVLMKCVVADFIHLYLRIPRLQEAYTRLSSRFRLNRELLDAYGVLWSLIARYRIAIGLCCLVLLLEHGSDTLITSTPQPKSSSHRSA